MDPFGWPLLAQAATPGAGVGPDELVDVWPIVVRAAWFSGGLLVVVLVGWYVVEPAISRIVERRNRNNPTIQEAISRYVRLLVVVVGVFVGAAVAGFGAFLSGSALVIAAGTVVLGVAGQTVIGSLVSGFVLVADPAFNVGNYIEWDDGEGTVESITLRVTRVETSNGEFLTVPNTTLTSQQIVRPYAHGRYRVVEHVSLAYEADLEQAIDQLESAADAIDGVTHEPAPSAYVDELDRESIIVHVHYWIEDPRRKDLPSIRSAWARTALARLTAADIAVSPPAKRDLQGRIALDEE